MADHVKNRIKELRHQIDHMRRVACSLSHEELEDLEAEILMTEETIKELEDMQK